MVTFLVAGVVPPRAATGVPRTAPEDPFLTSTLPRVVARAPYVEVHGQQWHAPRQDVLDLPVNGPYPVRPWLIRHIGTGERFSLGHDLRKQYSPLDYFLLMFPPLQLKEMVRLTKPELTTKNTPLTTIGEILKWVGIRILATHFELGHRRSLWSTGTTSTNKYIPAACFGKTGMSRNRFDILRRNICYSQQPKERPQGMSISPILHCADRKSVV